MAQKGSAFDGIDELRRARAGYKAARGLVTANSYFAGLAAASFLRSAQRRFIASAIRFRPSGVSFRFLGWGFATTAFFLAAPRFLTVSPPSNVRACWRRAIS